MTFGRLLAVFLLVCARPAWAEVRAVFVGIDRYEYSRARVRDAGFDDLAGAVGDVGRIKAALAAAYGLRLDTPEASDCAGGSGQQGRNAVSETLLDGCATKAAILAAWNRGIDASAPGDTLILYFAGHGSRFIDDVTLDQASRYNSTLMASDARKPGALAGADIIDHETRRLIDRATGLGVRVVTIFDSCNSGTASRDGTSVNRTAPDLRVRGLQPLAAPAQYGDYGAYRVHLAAAGDGQDAKEVGNVGARAGVFTTSLASALRANPQASFADIAASVVREVSAKTAGRQVPHAEGALRATLGGAEIRVATYDVALTGGRLVMTGGMLVGVTAGSEFALYPGTSEALSAGGEAPLMTTARVASVSAGAAVLEARGAAASLPGRMVAREVRHDFGGAVLQVAARDADILAVLARLDFVKVEARGAFSLLTEGGRVVLRGREGVLLARLPDARAADFAVRLAAALEKVARVEAWLAAVQQSNGSLQGGGVLGLCVQNVAEKDFDPGWCPAVPDGGRTLKRETSAMISVINGAEAPRFIYVLVVDDAYEVALVLPAFGAVDPAIAPGQALRQPPGQAVVPEDLGALRFVALASDAPLNAAVLEQSAAGVIDPQACLSAVARAFCNGADRSRGASGGRVNDWAAAEALVKVVP